MGLFKRKVFREDKSYEISEALNILDILKGKGLMDNYTLEPDENQSGKYKFIALEASKEKEERIRRNAEQKRAFYGRVNVDEQHRNTTIIPNDNLNYRDSQSFIR